MQTQTKLWTQKLPHLMDLLGTARHDVSVFGCGARWRRFSRWRFSAKADILRFIIFFIGDNVQRCSHSLLFIVDPQKPMCWFGDGGPKGRSRTGLTAWRTYKHWKKKSMNLLLQISRVTSSDNEWNKMKLLTIVTVYFHFEFQGVNEFEMMSRLPRTYPAAEFWYTSYHRQLDCCFCSWKCVYCTTTLKGKLKYFSRKMT